VALRPDVGERCSWAERSSIDERSARATLQVGETTASGVFTFIADGDLLCFEARRYSEETLADWLEDANRPSTFPSPSPVG
jgi:hypothetical protein